MKDLMIDIETMGNGSNAAMIQLAGVYFDPEGNTGAEFCANIDLEDSLKRGFVKDPSTEKWWKEQDQNILKAILSNVRPVEETMNLFSVFAAPAARVWSHATFDFVIVQNYLRKLKIRPMPHKGARDIRTLVDLSGINLGSYDWSKKTHNALDDCKFQVQYCTDAMKLLKGNKP